MAEPWDDSALINAFNSAIAKYKTMHGIKVEGKASSQNVTEDVVNMESNSQVVANSNEYEVEQSELAQKGENGGVPPYQADNVEEVPAECNGFADPQYSAQHHGHSASAENCYLCQWNAYYNQSSAWTSQAACCSNGLRCQYCGYVNPFDGVTKNLSQLPHTSQSLPDASAFPDIVKAAVAEALKTTDGQNSTSTVTESSQSHSSFSDVAVAWFLAGFHTSRYLSQSK